MIEHLEHQAVEEIGRRVARAQNVTVSMAIMAVRSHAGLLDDDRENELDEGGHWMSIATIAAKQAVLARERKATT